MDSDERRAVLDRCDRRQDARLLALLDRPAREHPEKGLPARADQHRAAGRRLDVRRADCERSALLGVLAEANARIDDDLGARDTGALGQRDTLAKLVCDLREEVVEFDAVLHRRRLAAQVRDHEACAALSDDIGHLRVRQAAHIVDDRSPFGERSAGDRRTPRVDADRR